jgi:hypothetical protein
VRRTLASFCASTRACHAVSGVSHPDHWPILDRELARSIHEPIARDAGLSAQLIAALHAGESGPLHDAAEDERVVFAFCRELHATHTTSESACTELLGALSPKAAVEIAALCDYHEMVAIHSTPAEGKSDYSRNGGRGGIRTHSCSLVGGRTNADRQSKPCGCADGERMQECATSAYLRLKSCHGLSRITFPGRVDDFCGAPCGLV